MFVGGAAENIVKLLKRLWVKKRINIL
jgi:hypothetical protein